MNHKIGNLIMNVLVEMKFEINFKVLSQKYRRDLIRNIFKIYLKSKKHRDIRKLFLENNF